MELKKEYEHVISFKAFNNNLFILKTDRNYSDIRKIDESTGAIIWDQKFELYIYEFALLGDKIYATTGMEPHKTFVLSAVSGEVLDDNFKAVLHLPLFSKGNERFICFATYNNENLTLRFTSDLDTLEIVNPKNIKKSRLIDEDFFMNTQNETVLVHDYENSNIVFQLNISETIRNIYSTPLKVKPKVNHVELHGDTITMGVIDLNNYDGYLFGLSLEGGKIKWHHRGCSNFELYNGKLYNIEFYGKYRVLNPETGEIEQEADLKGEFERMDINCEHRFKVTDTHIYFKQAIKGKFGILNLKTLKIEEVQQLPEGNTMSTEEYPISVGNRLYARSAPQNYLFVYEREIF